MRFSIPYNGDAALLSKLTLPRYIGHAHEIYFGGNPDIIASGRKPKIFPFIRHNEAANKYFFDSISFDNNLKFLIETCGQLNIQRNLLLNFSKPMGNAAVSYVQSLIDIGVNVITVGSDSLIQQARNSLFGNYRLQNSVYIKIENDDDITRLIDLGVSIILLPTEWNHDLERINKIISATDIAGIEFKLMINEGCIKNCSFRKTDQVIAERYSVKQVVDDFLSTESRELLKQPCRGYLNRDGFSETNFIHPEDIGKYLGLNLTHKIVGRSFNTDTILKIIESYINQSYDGDLRFLVENFKYSQKPIMDHKSQHASFLGNRGLYDRGGTKKVDQSFIDRLRQEKLAQQDRRASHVRAKFTFVIVLFSFVAALNSNAAGGSTSHVWVYYLLYLIPFVSALFDLYILGGEFAVKRIRAFLSEYDTLENSEKLWDAHLSRWPKSFMRTNRLWTSSIIHILSIIVIASTLIQNKAKYPEWQIFFLWVFVVGIFEIYLISIEKTIENARSPSLRAAKNASPQRAKT